MGRRRKEVNQEDFEKLATMYCTCDEISHWFNISHDALEQWVKRTYKSTLSVTLKRFRSKGNISIRRAQFLAVNRGHWPAVQRMGEIYLNQNVKQSIEISGAPDGEPIKVETSKRIYENLTIDELLALEKISEKIK